MSPEQATRFDIEVAFPCDIDLDWFLVPKAWVRQIVNNIIIKRVFSFIESFRVDPAKDQ